jgi:hypothetical protein
MPSARGRKPRNWREPVAITAANGPFEIDQEIRSLGARGRLQARWRSLDEAISFGRRALQVAREDAHFYKSYRPADEFEYFERASDLAASAHRALTELLDHIGPSGLAIVRDVAMLRVRKGFHKSSGRIRIRRYLRRKPTGGFVSARDAKEEVETLAAARDLLNQMQNYAKDQQKQLTPTNYPDYQKRAFVYRLAEAWIFLTGEKPGKGRDASHNPFLKFVEVAADDARPFKNTEDFYSALKWALQTLNMHESFDRETQQSISGIAARGPAWT